MYYIIEIDCGIPYPINRRGEPDKYSDPKMFETKEAAQKWIDKHTYKGMSMRYEIEEAKTT